MLKLIFIEKKTMKINISLDIVDGPYGGSHQFLKALKTYLINKQVYTDQINIADVILFNSHQHADITAKIKQKHPDKIFIHRVDGPIRLYNTMNDTRDFLINISNQLIADATVFQSEWSMRKNHNMGLKKNKFEIIIHNAPDSLVFNKYEKLPFFSNRKIRLIATSWSSNWKKGFQIYKWLDNNLDFTKYEMTFIGNSPVKFKNINHIMPLKSKELSEKLKKNDIFILASQIESCSNSLLEALNCGLPVVAFNDSSNPEIVGNGGELFDKAEKIPTILEEIVKNYDQYQKNISLPTIDEVGMWYYEFIYSIYKKVQEGKYKPKRLLKKDYLKLKFIILKWKLIEKINYLSQKKNTS